MLRPTMLLDKTRDNNNNNNKDTKDNDYNNNVNQDADDKYAEDDNNKIKTTITMSSCKTYAYGLR